MHVDERTGEDTDHAHHQGARGMPDTPEDTHAQACARLANGEWRHSSQVIGPGDDVEGASQEAGEERAHPCHSTAKPSASSGDVAAATSCNGSMGRAKRHRESHSVRPGARPRPDSGSRLISSGG